MTFVRRAVNGILHEKEQDSNGVTIETLVNVADLDASYVRFFAPDGAEWENGIHVIGEYRYDISDSPPPSAPLKAGTEIKLAFGRTGKAEGDTPAKAFYRRLSHAKRSRNVSVWMFHDGEWTIPEIVPEVKYESFRLIWTNYPSTEEERKNCRRNGLSAFAFIKED